MSTLKLTRSQLQNGVWEGTLSGAGGTPPQIGVRYRDTDLAGLEMRPDGAGEDWILSLRIPDNILSDGVQTLMIHETGTGHVIGSLALIAGSAASCDLRAELDLLRAELDLVKDVLRQSLRDAGQGA